jgi:hypothetical protein
VTGKALAAVPPTFRPYLQPALTGFVFALAATAWCAWTAGAGLPLFFGAILLAALYVPALTLAEPPDTRWLPPLTSAAGIITVWTFSLASADTSVFELLRCALLCITFLLAVGGLSSLLTKTRLAPAPSAAAVTLLALLWLTWPVWLSHALTQSRVNALSVAHPLLALNGVLRHLGAWDRAPLAYQRLTILNQDIPYTLPRSILPAVLLHSLIGLGCFTIRHLAHPRTSTTETFAASPVGRGLG